MQIAHDRLAEFVTRIFVAAGATEAVAREVADHLVAANLKGHDSHGVGMIPAYVANIRNGNLQVDAHANVLRDNGAVLMIDGGFGFGQVVGREATDLALERVRTTGIVCAGVRNCHHLGRIGTYGEQCGNAGYVSVHFVNVVGHPPQVSPFGGRERRMTTNPFCCVVPRPGEEPLVLDMATSAIALGKVRVAHMKGEPVPEGALVDHEGVPTSDASVMFQEPFGALGPFGAHKGYGLAVMCELLGGALAGEWTAQPAHPRNTNIVNHMLMFVLDPAALGAGAAFQDEVREMVAYLRGTTPARGFDRVRVPGEPEQESRAARLADGIPIDDNSWNGIVRAADAAGLSAGDIAALTG
ncbi:MAG: malate/lactate/ureidoglycolate dehydrogenase [Gammaproteobacteria bacterium]|nr:malate/lactate/ureidoglycolate dehydrogenase [Gammaproteobacteria bacterium]|tara:strand:+ start:1157 stop:2221 length:1065 start_codon:yes stop_codon:yes gene_type:complete